MLLLSVVVRCCYTEIEIDVWLKEVTTTSETKPTTHHNIRDTLLLIATGLLLLFAQSAYWLNHTIFDKQTFTSTITPIIQSESSRQTIASTITSKAFADKPIAAQLIGENVTALIAGLLSTDLAEQISTNLINRSYTYLTTDNPKLIAIDLTAIKTPLEKITEILESRGRDVQLNASNIPDAIVLFSPAGLPDIYSYSVLVLWLGPLFWLGFILLAVLYVYLGRNQYARRIYILGGTIILASCIGLLVGPLLPPPIVAQVQITELRSVVDQLIHALLAPFSSQNTIAIAITTLALLIFYLRFAIARGARWVANKTSDIIGGTKQSARTKK